MASENSSLSCVAGAVEFYQFKIKLKCTDPPIEVINGNNFQDIYFNFGI